MIFCHPQAHFFHRKILSDLIQSSSSSSSSSSLGVCGSYDCDQIMALNSSNKGRNSDNGTDDPKNNNNNNNNNEIKEQSNNASISMRSCNDSNQTREEIYNQYNQQKHPTEQSESVIQRVTEISDRRAYFISSFFIGLSFCNSNLKSADVTPSVLDFIYRVNIYDGKKENMKISVNVSTRSL